MGSGLAVRTPFGRTQWHSSVVDRRIDAEFSDPDGTRPEILPIETSKSAYFDNDYELVGFHAASA